MRNETTFKKGRRPVHNIQRVQVRLQSRIFSFQPRATDHLASNMPAQYNVYTCARICASADHTRRDLSALSPRSRAPVICSSHTPLPSP